MITNVKIKLGKSKSFCPAAVVFAVISLFSTATLFAAPAELDAGFGTGGKVVFSNFTGGEARATVVQPDGKIILAGDTSGENRDFTLARLNANGTLDTSFGTGGVVKTNFGIASLDQLYSVALLSNGQILAAGTSDYTRYALARYNSNGTLDLSFGIAGKVLITATGNMFDAARVVVQPDNKIVVAGSESGKFALYRLNSNGALDTTFGNAGKTITQIVTDGNATANVLLLQADGKFVVAGSRTGPTSNINSSPVARFNSNGALDTTFDNDGIAFPGLAFIRAGAIDANGKYVFGGQGYSFGSAGDFGVARLNSDGSTDLSFNGNGTVKFPIYYSTNETWINSLAIQSNGKIVAIGRSYGNLNGYDFTIARFNENGTPEVMFGDVGKMVTHLGAQQDWAYDMTLQTDGKIVVVGASSNRFAVARYMGGNAPRPHKNDFGGDGRDDVAVARANQPSGLSWFINNSQSGFKTVNFGLATDKRAAADYDGDGKTDVAVFRGGFWHVLRSTDNAMMTHRFGLAGDTPVPADYDGDGKADLAVVRNNPAAFELNWYLLLTTNGQFLEQRFGSSTDAIVPADYNGDGRCEIAVFRSGAGHFYISKGSPHNFDVIYWGMTGDKPVVADYDGDGKADAAVFRPSEGIWYVKGSTGTNQIFHWGLFTDVLVPGDYDGDDRADAAVYRDGIWYVRQSSNSQMSAIAFGQAGDQPLQEF